MGLLLSTVLAFGQAEQYEGKTIASVVYDPPAQPLLEADLARTLTLVAGKPFRAADAAATIDRMFTSGRYDDVQVDVQAGQNDRVTVRIVTTVQWFIGHVGVGGDVGQSPTPNQVVDATQLGLGQPYREADIMTAQARIGRLLERNGLYQYKMHVETHDREDIQQRDIDFIIDTGPRARYGPPTITGDPKLTEKQIIGATGWRWPVVHFWRKVRERRTGEGIAAISQRYEKDDRLTAQVYTDPPVYDPKTRKVTSTIEAHGGPQVDVKAVGAKTSHGVLKRYVPVFSELAVNRDLLTVGATNLRDYYQSKGYFEASVNFEELQPDPDHRVIEYSVHLGPRRKLVSVEIKGNKFFTTDDLRERMFMLESGLIRERFGRYSDVFRERDMESIANLYKSNGYREVKVTSDVQDNFKGKMGQVGVTLTVEEGSVWLVNKLIINGIAALNLDELRGKLSLSEGQPFSETSVALDRNVILAAYQAAGYSSAAFEWKANPDPENHAVSVEYQITEGVHQTVRDVILTGIETTAPRVVERHMKVMAGDPLSQLALSDIERQLYQLGIFARINLAIQNPDGDAEAKRVLFDFQESSRYTLAVGIGAEFARIGGTNSDLTQPAGQPGFSPRLSVDLSRQNLWGLGHTISLRGRISTLEQVASFNYLAPRFSNVEGRNVSFTTLYQLEKDVRTFSSKKQEASIQISQQLSKPSNLILRFAYRRVQADTINIPRLLIPQLAQPIRIGILSLSYVQDRRDNPVSATRGIYNTVDMGLASSIFGSQRNFGRVLARNATYHSITRNVILARETSVGLIVPFHTSPDLNASDAIPLPERFFGGGSASHRGFPENQAGPRDIGVLAADGSTVSPATGLPLGGSGLFFNQVELRFPLIGDNIGGVVFHDMGNIFDSVSKISFRATQRGPTDFNYMVHAAGFGVRYKTPIGPIRADLAYSINPPAYNGFKGTVADLLACGSSTSTACKSEPLSISHFQFFFSIGQTF